MEKIDVDGLIEGLDCISHDCDDESSAWIGDAAKEAITALRQQQDEIEELRAKLDNAEWCADVVSEANQQRGMTEKVREYFDGVCGADPWDDDEQNLFWAAQETDVREEALRKEIEELREALKFGQAQWESMAQQVEAAKALAEIYFEIAEETMPANEIRKKRDQKIAERAK